MKDPWQSIYLRKIPKSIPAGFVLVHNQVSPPTRRSGTRGFRFWYEARCNDAQLEVCPCGWAGELPVHYRVRKAWEGRAESK